MDDITEDTFASLIDNVEELKKHLVRDLPPPMLTKALNATLILEETCEETSRGTWKKEAFDALVPFRPCVDRTTVENYFALEKRKVVSGEDMTSFAEVFPKLMELPRNVSDSYIMRTAVENGSLWGVTMSSFLGFPMDDNTHGQNLMSIAIKNNDINMAVSLASINAPFNYRSLLALRDRNNDIITNFFSQIDIHIPDGDIDFIRVTDPETFAFAEENNLVNPWLIC